MRHGEAAELWLSIVATTAALGMMMADMLQSALVRLALAGVLLTLVWFWWSGQRARAASVAFALVGSVLLQVAGFWAERIYMGVWSIPAVLLPRVIALTDPEQERQRRVILMFLGVWIVIGNVLATFGAPVGPVFYDRLLGGALCRADRGP
jgi:hypothetical protein